ncbi:hypothetical protein [Haloglomus salinum]|jgi:hypothetical protein|uniref:hypothetical protein n=1 Tax=Haloglomus salinum TaxID=2962673 RepID=UPI0020C9A432|nr:hypothetical protein [Haloglomus salinum]
MDRTHVAGALLLAVCFGIALAAGPYGADIRSLASSDERAAYATGDMDATVLDTPETARLDRYTENGTDRYRLVVPDATVDVANVSGRPVLTYKLRIDGVGHTRGTAHVLSAAQEGPFRTGLEPSTLAADRVTNGSYAADLSLVVRSDRGTRRLHASNVTVRVTDRDQHDET